MSPSNPRTPADWQATRRMIERVVRAGGHLRYEQLEALVDRRGEAPAAEAHLRWCAQCRHELDDLQRQAEALRRPVVAARPRLWARWSGRWAGPSSWAGLVAALGIAAVSLLLVDLPRHDDGSAVLRTQTGPASGSVTAGLDLDAFAKLDTALPQAAAAWRAGNHEQLAALLRPAAQRGSAPAAAALGLLYAQGLGVPRDLAQARRYLDQAAQAGDATAARNLAIVQGWR